MKVKLKFDLSNHEGKLEFERANKSLDMSLALFEITRLRKQCYREIENTAIIGDSYNGIDLMSKYIFEILEKYDINTDKLIE